MNKFFRLVFLAIIFITALAFIDPKSISAQCDPGENCCRCSISGASRTCGITTNNCDDPATAQCSNVYDPYSPSFCADYNPGSCNCGTSPVCGELGETCCRDVGGFYCNDTSLICGSSATCVSCGGYGQPCCLNDACNTGYSCNTDVNLCLGSDRQCDCSVSGNRCNIVDFCGQGYTAVCTGDTGTSCTSSLCSCVLTSRYNPTTTPMPTQFFQCQDRCEHLISNGVLQPQYDTGNCTDSNGNPDPTQCANSNFDCSINGIISDCYCCENLLPIQSTVISRPRIDIFSGCGNGSINTAIGCIPIGDKNAFLAFILRWALGISGGISFIFIIYSGFIIMTATGDKRKVQAGRELLTAAISGIMLIIFSVFILDFIGIRILRIPGL